MTFSSFPAQKRNRVTLVKHLKLGTTMSSETQWHSHHYRKRGKKGSAKIGDLRKESNEDYKTVPTTVLHR